MKFIELKNGDITFLVNTSNVLYIKEHIIYEAMTKTNLYKTKIFFKEKEYLIVDESFEEIKKLIR